MSGTYQLTVKVANSSTTELIPHAFVTISGPGLAQPVTVGYYPQRLGQGVIGNVATGLSGPGTVKNDALTHVVKNPDGSESYASHPYDKSYTFDVTPQQAMNALQFAAQVSNNPGQYQLLGAANMRNLVMTDGYQCTGFARDMALAAGIQSLPLPQFAADILVAYPGALSIEFGTLGKSQYQPFRGQPSQGDIDHAVNKLYTGIKTFNATDQTPTAQIPPGNPYYDLTPTQRNNLDSGLSASGYAKRNLGSGLAFILPPLHFSQSDSQSHSE